MDGGGPGQVNSIARQFGLVMRKMWSGGNFKSSVSPQELVQELSVASKKRFCAGQRSDCMDLLVWLLRQLHVGLALDRDKVDAHSILYYSTVVHLYAFWRE